MENKEQTENEKKKEYLMSYQRAKRKVRRLERQLHELRLNKMGPSAINNDGMPRSSDMSDLSDYVAKLDEIERDIVTARYRRICTFQKIQRAIEAMEDEQEKDLLTYRYIDGLKWEEVAVKMGYSWQHIHKIHSRALKNLRIEQEAIESDSGSVI